MLQGQQTKLVGTKWFNANFNLFDLKRDGKVYYESEILKENLSSFFKIFTIEQSHGKSWFKSVGPE
jgi:cystathionine beta-lyase family protein involved in aluminum resistance